MKDRSAAHRAKMEREGIKMKKLFCMLLTLALLVTAAAAALAEDDVTIVVNLKTLSAEYWQTVKSGCDEAAAELGISIEVQGPAAETEIAEQVSQIETQLSQGPDAIVIAPDDNDAVIGAIGDYAGVVVFCDTDCTYENKVSFVGTSNEDAAYKGGVYGVAINGADTKAFIIYGQEGDNTSNLRKSGYEKALAEAGLEPVAELSGNNTADGAMRAMEDTLNAHPEINLVLCHNDDSASGALTAIEAAGVEGITVIGFNGDSFALDLIEQGKLQATIAQQPKLMGYQAVMTAYQAVKGEAVELNDPVDVALITAENVAEYK